MFVNIRCQPDWMEGGESIFGLEDTEFPHILACNITTGVGRGDKTAHDKRDWDTDKFVKYIRLRRLLFSVLLECKL